MNSLAVKELASRFHRDGFLILENFFDDELMDQYNGLILDHFGASPEFMHNKEFLERSSTEVIPWFPQNEGVKEFDVVENDQRLNRLTDNILGDGWYSDYSMVMFSGQGTKGQAWHQDCPPDDPSQFNMNRLIYTMDINAEIGGQTAVVPGSHRRGLLPAGTVEDDFDDKLILEPKKGTVILLHGHTWHKVLPVHGKYRVSTNYRSAPKSTPKGITDVCVYQNMRYRFSTSKVVEDRL
jgi:ectoine hydroxylase-related dioxygenase (phytanoyl-CoA dioxygenase family)